MWQLATTCGPCNSYTYADPRVTINHCACFKKECAELIATIQHFARGKVDRGVVVDELADVYLMVGQLIYMLGEEDLNPGGFHRMPPGIRLASMMTPTIASLADGGQVALGSGGSNRIRSAILQVLTNMLDFDMGLEQAVKAPRLHLEGSHLNLEPGFSGAALDALEAEWPGVEQWPASNLFFGGVHAVERLANGEFRAAGDLRRGGAVAIAGLT